MEDMMKFAPEPFKIKMVEKMGTLNKEEQQGCHQGCRLQYLPAEVGRMLYRPAHRLGHQRHERPSVGRPDAG